MWEDCAGSHAVYCDGKDTYVVFREGGLSRDVTETWTKLPNYVLPEPAPRSL